MQVKQHFVMQIDCWRLTIETKWKHKLGVYELCL